MYQRRMNTGYRIQKLMYITLPMYLLFYMALGVNDFDGANPLLGSLEGVGLENFDFFGSKWHSLR
jgi:hypothetical protein